MPQDIRKPPDVFDGKWSLARTAMELGVTAVAVLRSGLTATPCRWPKGSKQWVNYYEPADVRAEKSRRELNDVDRWLDDKGCRCVSNEWAGRFLFGRFAPPRGLSEAKREKLTKQDRRRRRKLFLHWEKGTEYLDGNDFVRIERRIPGRQIQVGRLEEQVRTIKEHLFTSSRGRYGDDKDPRLTQSGLWRDHALLRRHGLRPINTSALRGLIAAGLEPVRDKDYRGESVDTYRLADVKAVEKNLDRFDGHFPDGRVSLAIASEMTRIPAGTLKHYCKNRCRHFPEGKLPSEMQKPPYGQGAWQYTVLPDDLTALKNARMGMPAAGQVAREAGRYPHAQATHDDALSLATTEWQTLKELHASQNGKQKALTTLRNVFMNAARAGLVECNPPSTRKRKGALKGHQGVVPFRFRADPATIGNGDKASEPAQATNNAIPRCPVVVSGMNDPVLVRGKPKRLAGVVAYDVIEALVKRWPGKLNKDEMDAISPSARRTLKTLRESDQDFADVIRSGKKGMGYFICG